MTLLLVYHTFHLRKRQSPQCTYAGKGFEDTKGVIRIRKSKKDRQQTKQY